MKVVNGSMSLVGQNPAQSSQVRRPSSTVSWEVMTRGEVLPHYLAEVRDEIVRQRALKRGYDAPDLGCRGDDRIRRRGRADSMIEMT
jgi:hypothetical protein